MRYEIGLRKISGCDSDTILLPKFSQPRFLCSIELKFKKTQDTYQDVKTKDVDDSFQDQFLYLKLLKNPEN